MKSAEEIRADFVLAPDVAHLNHGSYGATPRPVLERQAELAGAAGGHRLSGG